MNKYCWKEYDFLCGCSNFKHDIFFLPLYPAVLLTDTEEVRSSCIQWDWSWSCLDVPYLLNSKSSYRMLPACQHGTSDLQLKVDFFRKLGYSTQEVQAALLKLGLDTDTNAVLGELVRSGVREPPTVYQESDDGSSGFSHRGGGGSSSKGLHRDFQHSPAVDEIDNDLKPIVIDGSNVAMR